MKKVRTHLLTTAAVVMLSGSAFAADMGLPAKAPAPAPIPYVGWQGWYIGGAIGAARLNTTATQTHSTFTEGPFGPILNGPCSDDFNGDSMAACSTGTTGFTAGVQVGYDWQSRYFVYGLVADWTWTGLKHTVSNNGSSLPFFTAKVDWLATFRGRMGLALDDTLVYLTGGLALAELKSSAGLASPSPFIAYTNALSKVQAGWVAGAGVEHKLNQNWSVFGEFLYYDLGRASATGSNVEGTGSYTTEFTHEIFQGKVGLNYRF
jgi:outer membrane immunogenic protein